MEQLHIFPVTHPAVKIGVLGAGHLGKIHLKQIREVDTLELVGFFDPDPAAAAAAASETGAAAFPSAERLLEKCDAIDVVTPTTAHFDCALQAIRSSKHLFIEKPVAGTVDEAQKLIKLVHEANVKAMVGHVERFNPAFSAARSFIQNPLFIETHRLAFFNPRGTDVSVILDLMIHDIDIILSVVKSSIKKISASGVSVVSESPDITNARIEFDNGCVANLTASRLSMKNMRKTRFFQKDAYISVDFLEKTSEVIRMKEVKGEPGPFEMVIPTGKPGRSKAITVENPPVENINAIREELRAFAHSIRHNTIPPVPIEDGFNALLVANQIIDKINVSAMAL